METSLPVDTAPYLDQTAFWPSSGEHILANYDADSIIVYQAYRPSIGHYAIQHGQLGGPEFSFGRMSWIKPNFLWMMFRSGWGTKEGQETTLGLRIGRAFFDELLTTAVASSFPAAGISDRAAFKSAIENSEVRRQWDPDHDPAGARIERRAIQLGLRGGMLRRLATEELIEVIDMSPFVASQRENARDGFANLHTPVERIYKPGG